MAEGKRIGDGKKNKTKQIENRKVRDKTKKTKQPSNCVDQRVSDGGANEAIRAQDTVFV